MSASVEGFGELDKDQLLLMSRTSESAERYEDMTKFMKALVDLVCPDADLNVEERNLLSVAYKNVVGSRRASWRTLNLDEHKNNASITLFRTQVEKELSSICEQVLALLKDKLVPAAKKASDVEAQVFYLKMAGDYYRYFAEFQPTANHGVVAKENYQEAFDLASGEKDGNEGLAPTHPIRLGLALNFSVCYYEILKEPEQACTLAKKSFEEAVSRLETLTENEYKDSTLIMQLLRDNLTLWTQDNQENDGEE